MAALAVLVLLALLIVLVPLLATVLIGFSSGPLLDLRIPGYTIENHRDVIELDGYLEAIATSLGLATSVVLVAGVLGTLTAIGARNLHGRVGALVYAAILTPVVFPSLAFGLALFEWVALLKLNSNLPALFLGHVILAVPFVARTVAAGLEHIPPEIEKGARSLGARGWYLLRRVTLPMVISSLLTASVFAFWISFDNFTISFFLSSPERRTIPIELLVMASTLVDPRLAAGATLLLIVSVPLLFLLRPLFSMRTIRTLW